jgi:beta-lactam-binding protein with PASTA domain
MSALKQAGLVPTFRVGKAPSRPDEAHRVYATNPAPGTPIPKGAAVQLTIYARGSVEKATTNNSTDGTVASTVRGALTVPTLVGSSAKNAKAALRAAGLNPRFFLGSAPPAPAAALHVYAQRPEPGAAVAAGDSVNIMIYSPGASTDALAAGSIQEELSQVAKRTKSLIRGPGCFI